MEPLDYAGTVFGAGEQQTGSAMPDIARRYARGLARHRNDIVLDPRWIPPTPGTTGMDA